MSYFAWDDLDPEERASRSSPRSIHGSIHASQVLIRWAVQRGTSVLPKSVTPSRIASNFGIFDWSLSEAQMASLSSIESQTRMLVRCTHGQHRQHAQAACPGGMHRSRGGRVWSSR